MRKTLYLLAGIPGSGKSYFGRDYARKNGIEYVSRDEIRFSLLKEGEEYFSHEDETWSMFVAAIRMALDTTGSCVADATHTTRAGRWKLLKALQREVDVHILYMNTPLELCLTRNAMRNGYANVPDNVICKMYYAQQYPTYDENPAFKEITYITKGHDDV